MKILIATPVKHTVSAEHAKCLVDLMCYLTKEIPGHFEYRQEVGSCIPEQRNRLVSYAIRNGFTHIFWLDSDIVFPVYVLHKLIADNVPVAAMLYKNTYDGSINFVDTGTTHYVSLGCSLVKTSIYNFVGVPYHTFSYNELEGRHDSEWRNFCERLPKGMKVITHHVPEVKHLHQSYI